MGAVEPGLNYAVHQGWGVFLTAYRYDRVLRAARTIADLVASPAIEPAHLADAAQLRRGLLRCP
ncbi:MAG TPA: hypothetical protein VJN44_09975 [Roseateles sp.]|nr:hypothetical protein [Roseateles sp.]